MGVFQDEEAEILLAVEMNIAVLCFSTRCTAELCFEVAVSDPVGHRVGPGSSGRVETTSFRGLLCAAWRSLCVLVKRFSPGRSDVFSRIRTNRVRR